MLLLLLNVGTTPRFSKAAGTFSEIQNLAIEENLSDIGPLDMLDNSAKFPQDHRKFLATSTPTLQQSPRVGPRNSNFSNRDEHS